MRMMRILIAEDDFAGRKILQKFLNTYGQCDVAVDGVETLNAFLAAHEEKKPYDLVCLDIMMPRLDGIKVLKALREIEKQKQIGEEARARIIMITALNDRKTVSETNHLGCEGYLWKPIDLSAFRELLYALDLTT